MSRVNAIQKILSRNDCGETGGHQAGILIPKKDEILSFFPRLGNRQKNPRYQITFIDSFQKQWSFSFIYYNNKYFGGTRNEFRLTGMTKFFKSYNLKAYDEITLTRAEDGFYSISFSKKVNGQVTGEGVLKLGNSWRIINF